MANNLITFGGFLNQLSIDHLIYTLLIIIGAAILMRGSDRFINYVEKKFEFDVTGHYLLGDILKTTIIIVGFAWILYVFGIDLESIVLSLGIVGITIGIASQDIVSNFISGIFVIGENKVKVGEVIEINGYKGTVQKVGLRNTNLINQDNFEITIPNSVLSKTIYQLYGPSEDHRLRVLATLPHGMNLDQFKKDLDDMMFAYDWVNKDKTKMLTKEYSEYGPKVEVSYWITKYKYINCGRIRILENINRLGDKYRRENGMGIEN